MTDKNYNYFRQEKAALSHSPNELFSALLTVAISEPLQEDPRYKKALGPARAYARNRSIVSQSQWREMLYQGKFSADERVAFFQTWQKLPLLMEIASDQALRNSVYVNRDKTHQELKFSIAGALTSDDLNTLPLDALRARMLNTITITLTRHPTNVYAPEMYDANSGLRAGLHYFAAQAYYRETDKFNEADYKEKLFDLLQHGITFAAAKPDYDNDKKTSLMEGREVTAQVMNVYAGMRRVTYRTIGQINYIKDNDRWAETMRMLRDEWRPVRLATWGGGPDQDNNFNAKESNMAQMFRESVAELKKSYGSDLFAIMEMMPEETPVQAKQKRDLMLLAMRLTTANDNHDSPLLSATIQTCKDLLDGISNELIDRRVAIGTPEGKLLGGIMDLRVKMNCFTNHPMDLDFRQDVSVTNAICDMVLGRPHTDEEARIKALTAMLDQLDAEPGDPRQRVDDLEEKVQARLDDDPADLDAAQMLETARTLRLMQDYPDCARQYTLSSFSKPSHWLEMQLLLKLGGLDQKGIVPLSESDEALNAIGDLLRRLSKEPQFDQKLDKLNHILKMMQAKSDPTRESGAFVSGSQTEWLIQFVDFIYENNQSLDAANVGQLLKAVLYVGGSMDNNRSLFNPAHIQHDLYRAILYAAKKRGLSVEEASNFSKMFDHEFQFTIQGRDANYCFGTDFAAADTIGKAYASSVHFWRGLEDLPKTLEQELKNTPEIVQDMDDFIEACNYRKKSYGFFFDHLLDEFDHGPEGAEPLPKELRKANNISSRVAGRGGKDPLTKSRAIDLQGFFHAIGLYANEWLGAEELTPKQARDLFVRSPEERRQNMSVLIGLARTDMDGFYDMIGSSRLDKNTAALAVQQINALKDGQFKNLEEALRAGGLEDMDPLVAIASWLEERYERAKINALCAAGATEEQARNWDFANGLPLRDHPLNDELKLMVPFAKSTRQLMVVVGQEEGLVKLDLAKSTPEKPVRKPVAHALDCYRTLFAASSTPMSASINGTISGMHKLTRDMVERPQSVLKFAS